MSPLDAVVKAYDIRGTVPDQLDATMCRALGVAFARFAGADRVLIGRDMRPSGVELVAAFADGVLAQGVDVVHLGLCSTDLVYFASGRYDAPAVMVTASHNPAQYNGLKLCLAGARPVGLESGLGDVQAIAQQVLDGTGPPPAATAGREEHTDALGAFADHVVSFIDAGALRPLKVVADTANGMGGLIVPKVFERLPIDLEVMYGELDGTFPNHPADPMQPANQLDLQARVQAVGADLGLAFDGDADRVFCIDETGRGLSGSTTTAMLAVGVLAKEPGATILHNCICSRSVPEVVREHGGTPIRTRVGHSFIKQVMAETGAAFGGEHSAHYYFRDNYRADSGIIAAMFLLEELSAASAGLSVLRKPYERYAASGEINTQVSDPAAVIEHVAAAYAGRPQDRLDGLTVEGGSWWFNLRPSNTEPLLRLNLEAPTRDECDEHVEQVLALVAALNEAERKVRAPMALDPQLLDILACPEDKGPLLYFADEDALYNPRLHRRYLIREGIPIMLVDEAEAVTDAEHERLLAKAEAEGIRPTFEGWHAVATLDSLDILGATMGLPEQVSAAAAALSSGVGGLPDGPISNVLVMGMGGSGIAGDVLAAVAGPVCPVPIVVHKDYELPGFVGADTLLLAVSASGNTEETLDVATEAVHAGARLVAVSQGGALADLAASAGAPHVPVPADIVMPRTGLGALVVPLLLVLEQLGLCPGASEGVDSAVEQLRRRRDALDRPGNEAERLARAIGRTIPLVYGGGALGAVAAQRWKAQCNENAKAPAFANRLPELCHNEVAGWGQHGDVTRQVLTLVELRHDDEHPQVGRRFDLVNHLVEEVVGDVLRVEAEGDGSLAQLFDLVMVGDVVSLHLAFDAGVDPGPIPALDYIKEGLSP